MASTTTTTKLPVSRLVRNITLRVDLTGVKTFRLRLWLGIRLLQLAALVIGCGIRFDTNRTEG